MTNLIDKNEPQVDIDLTPGDYWDTEKEQFVLTYGPDSRILTRAYIRDQEGVVWDCYLTGVNYYPESDQYEVYYSCF